MKFMDKNHLVYGANFDDVYKEVLSNLMNQPQYECSPRGMKIRENIAVTLVLENPRARLLTPKARESNYSFAVGEFLWYWNGKRDLKTMLYYNKRMKNFSDDNETLNSAYGYRLLSKNFFAGDSETGIGHTQWNTIVKTLCEDHESRRAVMTILSPQDVNQAASSKGSKDVPCTLSLQFFIRDNALDLHVHMRSNDVIWGLTYDLFSFTMLQECMLLSLKEKDLRFSNLRLGRYYHTAGSLHIYDTHFEMAEKILKEYREKDNLTSGMDPLISLSELEKVSKLETFYRTSKSLDKPPRIMLDNISKTSEWMIEMLKANRKKRDEEVAKEGAKLG